MSYPEHEKLQAVREKSQAIGEFLETVGLRGYRLAEYIQGSEEEGMFPIRQTTQDILAEYFEIDRIVLEREKQAMLAEQRRLNDAN